MLLPQKNTGPSNEDITDDAVNVLRTLKNRDVRRNDLEIYSAVDGPPTQYSNPQQQSGETIMTETNAVGSGAEMLSDKLDF